MPNFQVAGNKRSIQTFELWVSSLNAWFEVSAKYWALSIFFFFLSKIVSSFYWLGNKGLHELTLSYTSQKPVRKSIHMATNEKRKRINWMVPVIFSVFLWSSQALSEIEKGKEGRTRKREKIHNFLPFGVLARNRLR